MTYSKKMGCTAHLEGCITCGCGCGYIRKEEMSVQPISPEQAKREKLESIPDEVIKVVNDLIVSNFKDGHATVYLREVYQKLKDQGFRTENIKKWLDFEDLYRKMGWKVEYDQPGYNESYDAHFKFSKTTKHL